MGKITTKRDNSTAYGFDGDSIVRAQLTAVYKEFVRQQVDKGDGNATDLTTFFQTCSAVIRAAARGHSLFYGFETVEAYNEAFKLPQFLSFAEVIGLAKTVVASFQDDTALDMEAAVYRARKQQLSHFNQIQTENALATGLSTVALMYKQLQDEILDAQDQGIAVSAQRLLQWSQAIDALVRAQAAQIQINHTLGAAIVR